MYQGYENYSFEAYHCGQTLRISHTTYQALDDSGNHGPTMYATTWRLQRVWGPDNDEWDVGIDGKL